MIADLFASLMMVAATLLWSVTRWRHADDDDALLECAGACVLANAAALMLWLSGSHPQWAIHIWSLHAAGAGLIHGIAALAEHQATNFISRDAWWSPATYLFVALITGLAVGPPA